VLVTFSLLLQTPERKNLKGRRVYFDLAFQRFHSKINWIHCFGPERRQNILMAVVFTTCSHKVDRSERKKPGTLYKFSRHAPGT
jgi:hypothetical protein